MRQTPPANAVHNPVTNHSYLEQSGGAASCLEQSGGAALQMRFWIPPRSPGAPNHRHLRMTERFSVVEGELTIQTGGSRRVARAGETVLVPPGTTHAFENAGAEWLVFDLTADCAAFGDFFRCLFGLAQAGEVHADGTPKNPLAMLRILAFSDIWLPAVPVTVQKLVFAAASWLSARTVVEGRLAAYRAR